jgi:hypothetical protein
MFCETSFIIPALTAPTTFRLFPATMFTDHIEDPHKYADALFLSKGA